MARYVDWYNLVLNLSKERSCILNYIGEDNAIECWLDIYGKQYLYKAWKITKMDAWIQAIYFKEANGKLKLLDDKELKRLYDLLDGIGELIDEF